MSKTNLTPGDLAILKSDGPIMTVIGVVGQSEDVITETTYESAGHKEGDLICQWFQKDILQQDIFKPISLIKCEPEPKE